MKISESLKKISFREGFFFLVMLAAVTTHIVLFAQAPTEKSLGAGGLVLICFFAMCFLTDLFRLPSEWRAERMQILAGMCLSLAFLTNLGMASCYAFATGIFFTGQFFCTVLLEVFLYLLSIMAYSVLFFRYRERKTEFLGGMRKVD